MVEQNINAASAHQAVDALLNTSILQLLEQVACQSLDSRFYFGLLHIMRYAVDVCS